jgi:hypothetical protein
MKTRRPKLYLAIVVLALAPLFGPAATMQQAPKRPIEVSDVIAWKTVGPTVLSNDGQWFGYRSVPQEGDGEVVVRRVRGDSKEMRFPSASSRSPVRRRWWRARRPRGRRQRRARILDDAKWVAFTTYPTTRRHCVSSGSGGRSSRASRS